MAFCPPYWISDLLPDICIVFQQPIKTAPRTDLSRVARFVNPSMPSRNEDSRYEIAVLICYLIYFEWRDTENQQYRGKTRFIGEEGYR